MININELLKTAVEQHASDVHLSAGALPMMRIYGELHALSEDKVENNILTDALKAILPKNAKESLEYDFAYAIENVARFRVNLFYQARGIAAVFRIIPDYIPTLQEIDAPAVLKTLCELSQGLVLITGATGSGKSTTLAAMINEINAHSRKHIITLESPIEFSHVCKQSLIHQREIHEHTENYVSALRAALREDPDIIVVGEMRDAASIRLALTAAETGHLVISTLHTNSAIDAIDRIINVFSAEEQNFIRNMLSMSLQAVIAQDLVRKKEKGLRAVYEILIANTAVRNLIRENKLHQLLSVMQTSSTDGMITKEQAMKQLITQQIIMFN